VWSVVVQLQAVKHPSPSWTARADGSSSPSQDKMVATAECPRKKGEACDNVSGLSWQMFDNFVTRSFNGFGAFAVPPGRINATHVRHAIKTLERLDAVLILERMAQGNGARGLGGARKRRGLEGRAQACTQRWLAAAVCDHAASQSVHLCARACACVRVRVALKRCGGGGAVVGNSSLHANVTTCLPRCAALHRPKHTRAGGRVHETALRQTSCAGLPQLAHRFGWDVSGGEFTKHENTGARRSKGTATLEEILGEAQYAFLSQLNRFDKVSSHPCVCV